MKFIVLTYVNDGDVTVAPNWSFATVSTDTFNFTSATNGVFFSPAGVAVRRSDM